MEFHLLRRHFFYAVFFVVAIHRILGVSFSDRECHINVCNYTHPGLQCPRAHVIVITNVTCYGTRHHPCPEPLYRDVLTECSGRQRCSLRLLALQKLQAVCRKGPRVEASYTCIRKPYLSDHNEACTGASRLPADSGFVFSPGYPRRYSQTPCWWKIFLNRGEDVLFTVFEMQSFFGGSLRDTPDFLRLSPSVPAPSCPYKQKSVMSFREFRGDMTRVEQFRVRCHMEAEITLRQLSGVERGVRLMLFYQVIPSESKTEELLPAKLARSCVNPEKRKRVFHKPVKKAEVTSHFPTTITSVTTESSSPKPKGNVTAVDHSDNYIGLLAGLVSGGVGVCLVVALAAICLRRRKKRRKAEYNSISEGRSGSTSGLGSSGEKGSDGVTVTAVSHRDMSSGYASDSDSSDDESNNPTYESIEKYRLNDTYSRVADEISSPPPAPKSRDERENLDSVSATYAEVQSVMDERIPPAVPKSYRQFLRKQLAALEDRKSQPESRPVNTANSNSGPYAVSGYLCDEFFSGEKLPPKVPPKVPPKSPAALNRRVKSSSADSGHGGSESRGVTLAGGSVRSCPSQTDEDEDDVVFVDNDLYQPFTST